MACEKCMTLKRVTFNSFSWNKAGEFTTPIYAQIWTKIRSKLHARENARATLHPNKETFELKKNPALNRARVKRFKVNHEFERTEFSSFRRKEGPDFFESKALYCFGKETLAFIRVTIRCGFGNVFVMHFQVTHSNIPFVLDSIYIPYKKTCVFDEKS